MIERAPARLQATKIGEVEGHVHSGRGQSQPASHLSFPPPADSLLSKLFTCSRNIYAQELGFVSKSMPSHRGSILDHVRSMGLVAPLSKTTRDDALNPAVNTLYKSIDDISEQFLSTEYHEIRSSEQLKKAAGDLLRRYAPEIYVREGTRPWLLEPGDENIGHGLYTTDLYWDKHTHQE